MNDILSQGGDREPGPWPRRLAVITALAVAVAGGAVYLSLPRHQHAPAAAHPARVPAGPAPTLAWDSSLRLPAAGARPAWFWPASGRSELVGGLPADQTGYQFTRVTGGWAVQATPALPTGCDACAGPPTPVWFLADGARTATPVGTANLVAPAATAGAIWLTSYRPGANMTTAAGTAREASAAGPPAPPVTLPPGYAITQGTARGLLLAPVSQPAGAAVSKLWDPAAPRASQVFDGVLAASPGELAWTPRCAARCSVQVLNLATGRHIVIALPAGSATASGAFSPDGTFLALQVDSGASGDGGELATQLQVAPVATGRLTAVPGAWASSDVLEGFGWPGAGDSLVAEFGFTIKTELASWHPGATRPAVIAVRPAPGPAPLILG